MSQSIPGKDGSDSSQSPNSGKRFRTDSLEYGPIGNIILRDDAGIEYRLPVPVEDDEPHPRDSRAGKRKRRD